MDGAQWLHVSGLRKKFYGVHALDGVSFSVARGELVGLIGPNGSGKTTLLNVVTGFHRPDGGRVVLEGRDVTGLPPHRIARRGVARMHQITRVFRDLTVWENMMLAARALHVPVEEATARAEEWLESLTLGPLRHVPAGKLSGGQQKLLEFGACLMGEPRLLLLDEPMASVHPDIKAVLTERIVALHRRQQTFLMVSHDIPAVVELCSRLVVMNAGRVIADGPTRDVLALDEVVEAYLGTAVLR